MREIAIVTYRDKYVNYDDYERVVDSITDWTEVSEEDYKLLLSFSSKRNWTILERLDKKPGFVPNTVKAALEEVRLEEERQRIAKKEAERKKQERLLKKKAKDEAAEKKLLEELLVKHGGKV